MTDDERRQFKSRASSLQNHAKFCNDSIRDLCKRTSSGKQSGAVELVRECGEAIRTLHSAMHAIRNMEQAAQFIANRELRAAQEYARNPLGLLPEDGK